MAGLIFLWQNISSAPPVTVYTDYGIKPVMFSVDTIVDEIDMVFSPTVTIEIERILPKASVQLTDNLFTDVTTTWSDSLTTWSDSTALWGGSDRKGANKPVFDRLDSIRPILIR
jgi:hypothetical protein